MDRPVARGAANVGVVAALFAAGATVGGPVGGTFGGVAGEMLAGLVDRGWTCARDRFLGEQGILEPDLLAALRRAYACAVDNLERRWTQGRGVEWRPGEHGGDRGARGLFEGLRLDAAAVLANEGLRAAAGDPVALGALGNRDLTRGALRGYLDAVLRLQDEGLAAFVRAGLEPEIAGCFAGELKADRPENNRAWRAYQHLALAWILAGVAQVRAEQGAAAERLAQITSLAEGIEGMVQRLEARPAEERDPSGEAGLDEVVAARDRILAELADRTARVEAVVVREGEAVRADVANLVDEVRDLGQNLTGDANRRRAAAFESVDGFFRPFRDPARVFSHAFPLVGRDRHLALLTGFALSPRRVAVLSGPGGIGKSRLLKEALGRIEGADGDPAVYVLGDPGPFEPTMLDALPARQTLLAVDDAQRLENLGGLLAAARRNLDWLRVLLVVRPPALPSAHQALREARFASEEVLDIDLPGLTASQMTVLAREALGEDHAHLAEQVVAVTGDSPLVTVVAARLLALHEITPDQLLDAEQAQAEIFGRFQDVLLGQLGSGVDPARAREALDLLSAIGPFRAHVDPLAEHAADFLGVPVDQLRRLLERLADAGALIQRGGEFRVTPDLLSAYILKRAAVTDAGGSNGYAERVLAHFGDLVTENLLGNLVDLLPREVLRAVRTIVDRGPIVIPEITLADVFSGIPNNPYEGLPPILRRLSSDPPLRTEAFDLLWRLGQDDRRPPNQDVDHSIRILQDLAEVRVGRDPSHYDALLGAVGNWVDAPGAFDHRHSPLDVLDRLLEKEVSEHRVEGERIVWREYPVSSTVFGDVRRRAIRILIGLTRRDPPAAQYRALVPLLDALWGPAELVGGRVGEGEAAARTRENGLVFAAVGNLLDRAEGRLLSCVVERRLRRLLRGPVGGATGDPHRELLATLPIDHAAKLARYLWLGWTQIDFWADEADYERLAAATDQEVREVVARLVEQEPDADRLKARLERELGLISRHGVEPQPGYLLQTLAAQHPGVASPLAGLIVANPASPLAPHLPAVLPPLRTADPAGFRRAVDAALDSADAIVLSGTARVLGLIGPLGEDERAAVRRLAARPEPAIAIAVLGALRRFPAGAADEVDDIAAAIEIGSDPRLADALCEVYQPRTEAGLPPGLWEVLLGKLAPVTEIPGGLSPTHSLVDLLVRTHPARAAEFFVERIRRAAATRDDDEDRYTPVPHARFTRYSAAQGDPAARQKALGRVAALMIEPDGLSRHWLAQLFAIMSAGFDEVAVQVLGQLVADEGRYGVQQVQALLREAPAGFLFAHTDFVTSLLEADAAAGTDVLEALQWRLISAEFFPPAMARAGEPPQQFVGLKERAADAAGHQPEGSLIRALFERLASEAGDRIGAHLRIDDDEA